MLLSDRDLEIELGLGLLKVDPLMPEAVQPSSVDLRLAAQFQVFDTHRHRTINPYEQQKLTRGITPPSGEPFILHPSEFVLGSTLEMVTLPTDLAGKLDGKSSLGRLGLVVHSTAGFIDPGFSGHITLELSNVANLPIELHPSMPIAQICLFRLSSPAERPYGHKDRKSRYQYQGHAVPSRYAVNRNRTGGTP